MMEALVAAAVAAVWVTFAVELWRGPPPRPGEAVEGPPPTPVAFREEAAPIPAGYSWSGLTSTRILRSAAKLR
jgi:hypothetical protein